MKAKSYAFALAAAALVAAVAGCSGREAAAAGDPPQQPQQTQGQRKSSRSSQSRQATNKQAKTKTQGGATNPGATPATTQPKNMGTGATPSLIRMPPAGGTLISGAHIADGVQKGNPDEWTMQGQNYALTRYSELHDIDTSNVQNLKLSWTFATGQLYGHEGAPLVVGSTMYLVTPWPDNAFAIDLDKPGSIKWEFKPSTDPWSIGVACCDVVNRGWAYADGKLIYNLLDDRTIALDAKTGKVVWQAKPGDINTGETMTMAPLVVHDKVLVGNSGGEMGVHGWLTALDLKTGKELWRAYSTGPDSMVRVAADYHAFYPSDRGKNIAATSWPGDAWKHGAGAVWGWLSYDPELNLVYYGTSNPGPWNQEQRPGDNKWTSSLLARNPDTGELEWAYQYTPHDEWDYDGVNEGILVDLPIKGQMRKVLVHFDRNAFAYTIDRATGEVLVAAPYSPENWATGIDLKTGRPEVVQVKTTHPGETVMNICPPDIGGKDEEPSAFSPKTGLFYVPTIRMCADYTEREVSYIEGTPYWGGDLTRHAGPNGNRGALIAWDATTGRTVWSIPDKFPVYSGVLTTAGDVVFYGTVDGWFRAVNDRTGKILWQQKLGSGIIGAPMTYRGPDGKQYVAILAGVGGAAGVTQKVQGFPPQGGTLYVFSL